MTDLDELADTVRRLMAPYSGTWALCGGWAVDLWLGRVTREHGDIDIAVFRDEESLVATQLADWGLVAHETDDADHQIPWDGHHLAFPSHLHAGVEVVPRRELLVNERGEGAWILQHTPLATLPLGRFALPTPRGVPVMAPEAIAFYKSVGTRRPHDDQDLGVLLPLLSDEERLWIESASYPAAPSGQLADPIA